VPSHDLAGSVMWHSTDGRARRSGGCRKRSNDIGDPGDLPPGERHGNRL